MILSVSLSVDVYFFQTKLYLLSVKVFFIYLFVILPNLNLCHALCCVSFCCLNQLARLQTTTVRIVLRLLCCLSYTPDLTEGIFSPSISLVC